MNSWWSIGRQRDKGKRTVAEILRPSADDATPCLEAGTATASSLHKQAPTQTPGYVAGSCPETKDAEPGPPETRLCALGLGCDRGTPTATLHQAIAQALDKAGLHWQQVAVVASIDLKADEVCMQEIARQQHWHIRFFPAPQLASVDVPNPSETVRKYTGTPSVSEAAALLAGGLLAGGLHLGQSQSQSHAQALPATHLLVEKHKLRGPDGRNATVSIAVLPAAAPATP